METQHIHWLYYSMVCGIAGEEVSLPGEDMINHANFCSLSRYKTTNVSQKYYETHLSVCVWGGCGCVGVCVEVTCLR